MGGIAQGSASSEYSVFRESSVSCESVFPVNTVNMVIPVNTASIPVNAVSPLNAMFLVNITIVIPRPSINYAGIIIILRIIGD